MTVSRNGFRKCGVAAALLALVSLAGCQTQEESAVAGLAGGAAVGAGTGAIIGSVISNGDVAASALLGTAIGAPAGLALGLVYYANSDIARKKTELDIMRRNQEILFQNERSLEVLRRQVRAESPQFEMPNDEDEDDPYFGVGLGNPYR